MPRKRKSISTVTSASSAKDSGEEEVWFLEKILSFEELTNEFILMCDTDECNLQAWLQYEQSKLKNKWHTCIDCMLNDFDDWPSEEVCVEAKAAIPISVELELFVRDKCTTMKDVKIPSYISSNRIDYKIIENNNITEDNMPSLQTLHSIIDKGKNIGKKSVKSLTNYTEEAAVDDTTNQNINEISHNQESVQISDRTKGLESDKAPVQNNDNEDSAHNTNKNVMNINDESSQRTNLIGPSVRKRPNKMQRTSFSAILIKLEKDGVVNLKPNIYNSKTNKMHEEGFYITCLPCSMYRTKCNGQISLRRKYYEYYYNEHCLTEGHIEAMSMFNNRKKFRGATNKKTYRQGMIDNFLVPKTVTSTNSSNTSNESSTAGDSTPKPSKRRKCVGIVNSIYGIKRKFVPLVCKYIKIQSASSYEFGYFQNEPAIFSKKCDGVGKFKAIDGGLACHECVLSRRRQGNSNPVSWLTKCYYQIIKILDYRNADNLLESDLHHLQSMLKVPKVSERYTPLGVLLHKECQNNYDYLKEMIKMQKQLNDSKPKAAVTKYQSSSKLFENAAEMYEKEEKFRNSLVVCLLKSAVYQHSAGVSTIKKESKLIDFYRYLQTISNQSCKFVSANLGLNAIGISDRWLRHLNSKDRGDNVFKCEVKDIYNSINKLINKMKVNDKYVVFSIAIDGTKVPMNLSINSGRKCILGGGISLPHHRHR